MTDRPLTDEQRRLVESVLPMIQRGARIMADRYRSISVAEFMSAGYAAAVACATSYDPEQTATFATYVYHRMRGAMLDEIGHTMNKPWAARKMVRVSQILASAEAQSESGATLDEVMAQAEADPHETARATLRERAAMLAASALVDEPRDPEELLIEQERRQRGRAAIETALGAMPERARKCVQGVFYDERSLGDLARELGVTERTVARDMVLARKRFETALRSRDGESAAAR